MVKPREGRRQRFWYALEGLPGAVLHLLGSAVAWTFIQLSGLMVARCGASQPCNSEVIFLSLNGIKPVLIVVWVMTTVLALARPLARGLSPWPVVGIGVGASILISGLAYLVLNIAVGRL